MVFSQPRSWATDDLVEYLQAVEGLLAQNPLLGRPLDDDLWIELKATRHRRERRDEQEGRDEQERRDEPPRPLDGLVSGLERSIILCGPGSGKSEWLRRQARAAAMEACRELEARKALPEDVVVPIFLPLSLIAAELDENRSEALCRLAGRMRGSDTPDMLSPDERAAAAVLMVMRVTYEKIWSPRLDQILWVKLMPQAGPGPVQALLCLDSWDETSASQKELLRKGLPALLVAPHLRVQITSRPGSYEAVDAALFDRDQEFEIRPFTRDDTKRFIEGFFKAEPARAAGLLAALRDKPHIAGFAENPLQATLLCMIYEDGGNLPLRRVELYQRTLDQLMTVWLERNRPNEFKHERNQWLGHPRGRQSMLGLLQAVAEEAFPATTISSDVLFDLLAGSDRGIGYLSGLSAGNPVLPWVDGLRGAQAVGDALCDLGLMTRSGDDYAFLHTTIQEYLVAAATTQRAGKDGWPAIADEIDRHAWAPAWREVVILLAGLMEDPEPLIELLADPRRDDVAHHRTILAALALQELRPESRDRLAPTINRITDIVVDNAIEELEVRHAGQYLAHFVQALPSLLEVNGTYHHEPLQVWLARDTAERPEGPSAALFKAFGAAAATPEILAVLMQKLNDPNRNVSYSAAAALGSIGSAAATPEILTELLSALKVPNNIIRWSAATALGEIGSAAATPEILTELLSALKVPNNSSRWSAATALGEIGSVAATPEVLLALTRALVDPDVKVRSSAVDALGQIGSAAATPEVLVALTRALVDPETEVRCCVALAFGKIGSEAATPELFDEILAALTKLFDDPETWVQLMSVIAMSRIDASWPEQLFPNVLKAVLCVLDDPIMRDSAVDALGQIGWAAATPELFGEMLAALTKLFDDPDQDVRWMSVHAIFRIGARWPEQLFPNLIKALLRSLDDPDQGIRSEAAIALSQIGSAAATPDVISALLLTFFDANNSVRNSAEFTLGKIELAAAPTLLRALDDPSSRIRASAVRVLGLIGAAATPEDLAALLSALTDPEALVRNLAANALGKIGENATLEVVTALLRALDDVEGVVREAAVSALGKIGQATPEVITRVLTTLIDPDVDVRRWAAYALGRMGRTGASWPEQLFSNVLKALQRALEDPEENMRRSAARALGEIGPAAATPDVITALLRMRFNPDYDQRAVAVDALAAMGHAAATPEVLVELLPRATWWLGQMGPAAIPMAHLIELNTPIDIVRSFESYTLGNIRPAAATPEFLSEFGRALQGREGSIKPGLLTACTGVFRVFASEPNWTAVALEELISGRYRPGSTFAVPTD